MLGAPEGKSRLIHFAYIEVAFLRLLSIPWLPLAHNLPNIHQRSDVPPSLLAPSPFQKTSEILSKIVILLNEQN